VLSIWPIAKGIIGSIGFVSYKTLRLFFQRHEMSLSEEISPDTCLNILKPRAFHRPRLTPYSAKKNLMARKKMNTGY
jgi:hypothetical protein